MNSGAGLLILAVAIVATHGHVRMREPPNRSSMWRDPRFEELDLPQNFADDALDCGALLQPEKVDNCGICGDAAADSVPRANENGGIYGNGVLAGNYTAGQEIPVALEFTMTHLGFVQIQLCPEILETEECFNNNVLTFPNGETDYFMPLDTPVWVNTTIKLPVGVTCDHCALRLHYRAGLLEGACDDGTVELGCGPQEVYRSCSDISIV